MFQKLANHNEDLRRLVDKGYAVSFDTNHLVIRDIPYLNDKQQLERGAFVCKLVFTTTEKVKPDNHVIFFSGSTPHGLDRKPIPLIGNLPVATIRLPNSPDIQVQRRFSNKPKGLRNFNDFFDKVEHYVTMICGPAIELYGVTPFTYRQMQTSQNKSVFHLQDTLTSRAEITELSELFENEIVTIIGMGGTGSYLLDYLVKTPVKEIRIYDNDLYHVHNAFRSPGAVDSNEFNKNKAEVFAKRYENFRTGISFYSEHVTTETLNLNESTFVFVCVDSGQSRRDIFDLLLKLEIPFIDVGMGLNRKHSSLNGLVRTTYFSREDGQATKEKGFVDLRDQPDNIYKSNIQIAELNALNASLAIIKYKQLKGFYYKSDEPECLLFEIGDMKIVD
ncbi:hypothetical protein Rhal01_03677 [Rubritalea halochordaticola]|uniref:ThiF family adenylyltransferase n=1 Tax=Rubritalea halochordaticola TaxID=714537 RepID=A0ABP9V8U5_9BACT